MGDYAALLNQVWGSISERPAPPLPPELELQAVWFAGGFGRHFHDTRGRAVRIVQFGEWNRNAGPDFLHAVVEIDGERQKGAIELDPRPTDWEAHGHGGDPAFAQVVLHVTFPPPEHGFFTRDLDHREIPRVEISAGELAAALSLPSRATAMARPGRCVEPLSKLPAQAMESLLNQAAQHRLQLKTARILRAVDAHGRDQALFQATAETLGYRANALPMRLLSQRIPITPLRATESPEAVVFGCAGFLAPDLHESAPADTREQLRELWDAWWKCRASWESTRPIPWVLHGNRPANHPHRRAAALATLAAQWPAYRTRALARPFHVKPILDFLQALSHPFWSHRHTLTSAPSRKAVALVGKSRALELIVNHLAPLALHEDPNFTLTQYAQIPLASLNEPLRRCILRLFGSEQAAAPWLKKSLHAQALLQIYQDFCLEDDSDCQNCPFPEQLAQWR